MIDFDAISIKEVENEEELARAHRIREEVLEVEQGFPHEVNVDGQDAAASHVLVLDGAVAVGTGRVVSVGPGEGKIARIALLPSYRGHGLGERLIRRLEDAARRRGLETLYLEPHPRLEAFGRKLGYEKLPSSLELGGHQLISMRKRLAPRSSD